MTLRATVSFLSDLGRVRSRNEDAARAAPDEGLVVVADGMGGHPGGDVASRVAAEAALASLLEAFANGEGSPREDAQTSASSRPDENLEEAVGEAMVGCVLDAHRAIRDEAERRPELQGMGTTLLALRIAGASGRWAVGHAGDSRAYLLRDGTLEQVTRDDTWLQDQVDAGHIPPEEARGHPASHVLAQALGLDPAPEPHCCGGPLRAGDRFLLCTDGLTDMVPDETIARLLGQATDGEAAARMLVEEALERGGHDNVTVAVVEVEEA